MHTAQHAEPARPAWLLLIIALAANLGLVVAAVLGWLWLTVTVLAVLDIASAAAVRSLR